MDVGDWNVGDMSNSGAMLTTYDGGDWILGQALASPTLAVPLLRFLHNVYALITNFRYYIPFWICNNFVWTVSSAKNKLTVMACKNE